MRQLIVRRVAFMFGVFELRCQLTPLRLGLLDLGPSLAAVAAKRLGLRRQLGSGCLTLGKLTASDVAGALELLEAPPPPPPTLALLAPPLQVRSCGLRSLQRLPGLQTLGAERLHLLFELTYLAGGLVASANCLFYPARFLLGGGLGGGDPLPHGPPLLLELVHALGERLQLLGAPLVLGSGVALGGDGLPLLLDRPDEL